MNTNASVVAPQTTVVKILPNDKGNPPGKLADAELHFVDGALVGLKLIGFALLRPAADTNAQDAVRDLILATYAAHEEAL